MRGYMRATGSYATVGLEIVFSIVFGFLLGRWLDGKFGTEPYLLYLGVVLGLVTAVRFVWRAAMRMTQDTATDGFRESQTDRGARYALEHRKRDPK